MVETPKDPVPFTQMTRCPSCNGRGWKQQVDGYSLIPCPVCKGKRVLPEWDTDGRWMKKVISGLTKSNQEMMK